LSRLPCELIGALGNRRFANSQMCKGGDVKSSLMHRHERCRICPKLSQPTMTARGLLVRVESQHEVREAKDGARRLAVAAANGFRQCMVRAMGEGVAVKAVEMTDIEARVAALD
jgi:hypothetical protein